LRAITIERKVTTAAGEQQDEGETSGSDLA
jgi:hypothetical protein